VCPALQDHARLRIRRTASRWRIERPSHPTQAVTPPTTAASTSAPEGAQPLSPWSRELLALEHRRLGGRRRMRHAEAAPLDARAHDAPARPSWTRAHTRSLATATCRSIPLRRSTSPSLLQASVRMSLSTRLLERRCISVLPSNCAARAPLREIRACGPIRSSLCHLSWRSPECWDESSLGSGLDLHADRVVVVVLCRAPGTLLTGNRRASPPGSAPPGRRRQQRQQGSTGPAHRRHTERLAP